MKTFIFIFVIILLTPISTNAVESAIISSERAIVYSDAELATPIGIVKRGKNILVGEHPIKKGLIYTIVLPGRIAYIQAKDLRVENNPDGTKKSTEHNIDVLEKPAEEIYSKNNYFTAIISSLSMGNEWSDLQASIQDGSRESTTLRMNYWRFLFEHRDQRFKLNWSLGLDMMGKEIPHYKFSAAGIEGNVLYSPIRTSLITTDLFLGVLTFPFVRAQNDLAIDGNKSGKMWGYQYGAQVRIFPYSTWGGVAGIMYTSLFLTIDPVVIRQESAAIEDPLYTQKINKIKGLAEYIGISYKF